MTPETFVQHLPESFLWLEVRTSEGNSKLVLSGEKTRVTNRIRDYIKNNRDALINYLIAHPMFKSVISDDQPLGIQSGEVHETPTHPLVDKAHCFACQRELDEQVSYRHTNDGTFFCQVCWDERHVTPDTLDLPRRVAARQARPCSDCGGYDWTLDDVEPPEGLPKIAPNLECPCRLKRLQANRRAAALHQQEYAREAKRKQQEQEEAERKRNRFKVISGKRQIA